MFKEINALPADPILRLTQLCREDPREQKIDVGVGIFMDESGNTPIMSAVKKAEKIIWENQNTKKYQPLSGNPEFGDAIANLVLKNSFDKNRVRVNQATGGTGALRAMADTIKSLEPEAKMWIPNPTWGNHLAIFGAANLKIERYKYLDPETSEVDREAVFSVLKNLGAKDMVLLHGCCHNPSGADFSKDDWKKIAELANKNAWTPIIDFAYLGLGESIDDDAWGVRYIVDNVPQSLIAVSCSKNFALYRERCGAVISVGQNTQEAWAMQTHVNSETRKLVSMAPDHPAAIVATVLNDDALKAEWEQELISMCQFIRNKREQLQKAMGDIGGIDWSFITRHHGMFSLLPLGEERVHRLRKEFAIYMVGTGRINLVGLRNQTMMDYFANSIKAVL